MSDSGGFQSPGGWGAPEDAGTQWGSGQGQGQGAPNPWAQPPSGPPQGGPYGAQPYGTGPGGYGGTPYGGYPSYNSYGTSRPTSGLAIASLVVSLGGFVTLGFSGIVGFILGLVARSQIKSSGGRQGGEGMALAGIIIGLVMFLGFIGFIVLIASIGHTTTYSYHYGYYGS